MLMGRVEKVEETNKKLGMDKKVEVMDKYEKLDAA